MRILINGINLHSAGGLSLGRQLMEALDRVVLPHEVRTLVSNVSGLAGELATQNMELVELTRRGPRKLWRMLDDTCRIRALCREYRADVCFSLGDLAPRKLPCPHAVLVHNPWLLYDTAEIASRLTTAEQWTYRHYYPWKFQRMAPHLRAVTVQTPVAARRVRDRYGLDESRIHVVPSACTIKPLGMLNPDQAPKILRNVDAVRFLFLAQFYPHKNHEILIPVLRELREQGFERRVHFFLTITPEHPAARDLLSRLNDFDSMVTNLGPIPAQAVQHHLAACHALFLPTLLETFGLVYLEAMSTGTAILTSDRDFSRYVCGDYAEFFEPTDPAGVVRSIVKFVAQQPKAGSLASKGAEWLAGKFITWDDVAARYLAMLESCAEIDGPNGVA